MKKILLKISSIFLFLLILTISCYGKSSAINFEITGIPEKVKKEITENLQTKAKSIKNLNKESIENFYSETPEEISKILKINGYFNSTIATETKYNTKIFNVKQGPPLIITEIDLKILGEGSNNKIIKNNVNNFPLKKGEIFQTKKYNTAKQFLFDLADEYGYIGAYFKTKEIQIDLGKNRAKIILHFDTGPRYYFGKTNFNTPNFSKSFLKRFLTYKPDDYYSSEKISLFQESLNNSNLFKNIDVKPKTSKAKSHKIPIEVTLTPHKPRKYSFGVGFSTDTGVRGSIETEFRYLTKTGQRFKGLVQASQIQNNLELHYLIPGSNPSTDLYNISLAGETIDIDKGKSRNVQTGVGYTTIVKKWQQTIKLILQHERYKLINQSYRNSTLLIPGINLLYTKKDNQIKPMKGYRIIINLQGTSKYIASSTNLFQSKIDAKALYSFPTNTQVVFHTVLGYTAIKDINNLPLSLQFYTGGTQSIRGFKYNSIGPGRNIAVGSVELRQKIFGDWYLATFFDAGNVNDNILSKPKKGLGAGIVWRTSIGTLELTYAKAISEPGNPGRVQFSMGPEL